MKKYAKLKLFCLYKLKAQTAHHLTFQFIFTMTTSTSIPTIFKKQLLIDSIHALPEDILQVIKENVFHDRDVLYKQRKNHTMLVIKNAYSNYSDNDDENEHWGFFAENETIDNHIFSSNNCSVCGNYYFIPDTQNRYTSVNFSDKIWCTCNTHNAEFNDEHDDGIHYEINEYEIDEYDEHERMVDMHRDDHTYSDDEDDDFDDFGVFNSYRSRYI